MEKAVKSLIILIQIGILVCVFIGDCHGQGWNRQHRQETSLLDLLSTKQLWEKEYQHKDIDGLKRAILPGRQANRKVSSSDENASAACSGGRLITCSVGTAVSQGYPDSYDPNSVCSWTIKAEQGKVIEVDFVDFSLEDGDCSADYVSLSDRGSSLSLDPAVTYCGNTIPPKFSSAGNEVEIRFVSDGANQGKGFLFNFSVRDPVPCEDLIEVTGQSGRLTSLNYPANYLPHSNCRWRIVSPAGTDTAPMDAGVGTGHTPIRISQKLTLTFEDLSLESARSCEWDSVSVYDGGMTDGAVLGTYCGNHVPDPVQTSSNIALVVLGSDESTEDKGFVLTWQSA